jgi:hypothetical protein
MQLSSYWHPSSGESILYAAAQVAAGCSLSRKRRSVRVGHFLSMQSCCAFPASDARPCLASRHYWPAGIITESLHLAHLTHSQLLPRRAVSSLLHACIATHVAECRSVASDAFVIVAAQFPCAPLRLY